jgi:hypothetical protein
MVVREGDPAILVDWFKADDDAKCFPNLSSFRSANWVNRWTDAGDLGEQPGVRTWRKKDKPSNGGTGDDDALACANSHLEWWENGLGSGDDSGPYDDDLLPTCCGPQQTCCECDLSAGMELSLDVPACSCLHLQTFSLTRRSGTCIWDSPIITCNSHDWRAEVEIDGSSEPSCSILLRLYCDDVLNTDVATSFVCADGTGGDVATPEFNACCQETIDWTVTWTPP